MGFSADMLASRFQAMGVIQSSSFGRSRECWRIAEGEAHLSVIGSEEANFRRCSRLQKMLT